MANIITNIRDFFSRPTRSELVALSRALKSKQGIKVSAMLQQQSDSLTKKDVADWRAAHQMAIDYESPNRCRLYDIYADCVLDAHLSGCIAQRKGKVLQKDFRLVDQSGKEKPEATELLQSEWFADFLSLCLDSIYWGPTLIQLGDVVRENGPMRFSGVELVPRKHVVPEYGVLVRDSGGDWRHGIPYREGDIANWCVEVGKPRDLGLLLKCAPSCISKKNMLAYWDVFGEIFGMPMRIARANTLDDAERARLETALDRMGAAQYIVTTDGTEIEIKESSRGDAYNVYDRRVDRCNSELSKVVLNQTMTIDSGASLSQSEVHLEIFERTTESDAVMCAHIVNGRLLPLMELHGFPVKGLRFQWNNAAAFSPAENRENLRLVLEYFNVPGEHITEALGIPVDSPREAKTQPDRFFD
ncbi:phage portal protein family protein [Paramuribaculum intestinale]|uniref:phage portal protein family protein n=1 Tax=Paramuribaculum intestinale TaxID=2094151 RepID=UPI00261D9A90|nr:DUF935 family protein [Paramuribaculum intestinale]